MKVVLLALGVAVCFARSTIQDGSFTRGPFAARAGSSQPFTAEAIIETDQTLVDSGHVVNRQTVRATRHSQRRTYRKEILATPATGSPALKVIFISDSVVKTNDFPGPDYVIHKTPVLTRPDQANATSATRSGAPAGLSLRRLTAAHDGGGGPVRASTQASQPPKQLAPGSLSAEQQGMQVIAEFEASGTRTRLRIPAGKVGNQITLLIVSERWYSQDFEATAMAKHSDLRLETFSYHVTAVQQTEPPPPSSFQIPAGYTGQEDGQ